MTVKFNGSGGGGSGPAANQNQVDGNLWNSALNALRFADNEAIGAFDGIDGRGDVFTNENGINTATSTGESYNTTQNNYTGASMVLVSNAVTANEAPTKARAMVLYEDISTTAVLNTDCTLEFSMDGGVTYSTAFTLEDSGATVDMNSGGATSLTANVLITDYLTLDSTSGTSIVWRWSNLNSKDQTVNGIFLRWDA